MGVEAVTAEGLKSVFKDFNYSGDRLVQQLQTFREHGVHVLGSFIFGLPTDRPDTFDATAELAKKADVTFAQFVMMTPFPGTVDFHRMGKSAGCQSRDGGRHSDHPLLADSRSHASEDVHAPSDHEVGRDSRTHAGRLGPFLQLTVCLGTDPVA